MKSIHKTAKIRKISESRLKWAMEPLEKIGIYYESKDKFFAEQAPLVRALIRDPEVNAKTLRLIRRFLKRMKAKTKVSEVFAKHDCPIMGKMYVPCQNKACIFWGDFESQLNCMSHYMKMQGRNTLSVAEMGIFTGYSRSHINDILNTAEMKLRRHALRAMGSELFGSDITPNPSLKDGVCCNCGAETSLPKGYFSTRGDPEQLYYCSFSCWTKKSPLEAFIEKSAGGRAEEVFSHLPRVYRTLEEAAKCLTVSEAKLESVLWSKLPENSLLKDRDQPHLTVRDRGKKFWEKQEQKWKEIATES